MLPQKQPNEFGELEPSTTFNPTQRKRKQYTSAACDQCRKKKVRCVVEVKGEPCNHCLENCIPCTYLQPRKKRGPKRKKHKRVKLEPMHYDPNPQAKKRRHINRGGAHQPPLKKEYSLGKESSASSHEYVASCGEERKETLMTDVKPPDAHLPQTIKLEVSTGTTPSNSPLQHPDAPLPPPQYQNNPPPPPPRLYQGLPCLYSAPPRYQNNALPPQAHYKNQTLPPRTQYENQALPPPSYCIQQQQQQQQVQAGIPKRVTRTKFLSPTESVSSPTTYMRAEHGELDECNMVAEADPLTSALNEDTFVEETGPDQWMM